MTTTDDPAADALIRLTVRRRRVLTADAATAMVGTYVDAPHDDTLLPSPRPGQLVQVVDDESDVIVGMITRLPPDRTRTLRYAVMHTDVSAQGSGRVKSDGKRVAATDARTFGYTPRKPMGQREGCYQATMTRDNPGSYEVVRELSGWLGRQFQDIYPERAAIDAVRVHQIKDDWLMDEDGYWTSGIVNRTAVLPYHRDGANMVTWSAMPVVRYGVTGGTLHLPEYAMTFPCRDGEVAWFCGKELVHGVTPMASHYPDAYRYSVVYYARAGMVNCRTYAEETANVAWRRTVRERQLAAALAGDMIESPHLAATDD